MPIVFDIEKYQPKLNETFFFDNNVWMFLFCPVGNYEIKKQRAYAEFFKRVQSSRSAIFINSLVLSEFCNRWLRIEYAIWKKKLGEEKDYKKDFVGSSEYKSTVKDIKDAVNRILSVSSRVTDDFNAIEINEVYNEFSEIDFNDSYFIVLAHKKKWKIITDDFDFQRCNNKDIVIITANIK